VYVPFADDAEAVPEEKPEKKTNGKSAAKTASISPATAKEGGR